jgi:hypothetical protein
MDEEYLTGRAPPAAVAAVNRDNLRALRAPEALQAAHIA